MKKQILAESAASLYIEKFMTLENNSNAIKNKKKNPLSF